MLPPEYLHCIRSLETGGTALYCQQYRALTSPRNSETRKVRFNVILTERASPKEKWKQSFFEVGRCFGRHLRYGY